MRACFHLNRFDDLHRALNKCFSSDARIRQHGAPPSHQFQDVNLSIQDSLVQTPLFQVLEDGKSHPFEIDPGLHQGSIEIENPDTLRGKLRWQHYATSLTGKMPSSASKILAPQS